MYDFHTHTIWSDGELLPSELVRRYERKGYRAVAITDHADLSNLSLVVERVCEVAVELTRETDILVIPGVELTHVPPRTIERLVVKARDKGAKLIVLHGETIVEPVPEKTNLYGVESGIDILAHPGLVDEEVARRAERNNVFFEISGRKGHSLTNGHVVRIAKEIGVKLLINSDAHSPSDIMEIAMWESVGLGAGLRADDLRVLKDNANALLNRLGVIA